MDLQQKPTDQELISAIAEGDAAAFAAFYDRHSPYVYGLLRCILRVPADAEEALQEVFWQVWTKSDRFDQARAAPRAWLTVITRSRARDLRRRLARANDRESNARRPSDRVADASENAERAESMALAQQLLAQLPEEQRTPIQRCFFDGMTQREIAEHDQIPLGTIKTRIRSGLIKLRGLLG